MTGEITADTAGESTDVMDALAPPVRFEPCAGFRLAHGTPWAICGVCGWLEDDHGPATQKSVAVVTELPRRTAVLPERMAS